jgi:uncharacterized damage-inducible protein DinB
MDMLDRLLDHDRWATGELLRLSGDLTDEQLDREFDLGYRSVRRTFGHMIHSMEFWTALMRGRPAEPERFAEGSIEAIGARFARSFQEFADLARQIVEEGRLDETFIDHFDVRKSLGGTILMVILHDTEHRTEIVHMLVRLGVPEPLEVDLGLRDYLLLNT